jgi:hypothetical protein
MALTKIDCQIYRSQGINPDRSLYAVLNPSREPGSLVAAGTIAARENIGGQVACRLALEHFLNVILELGEAPKQAFPTLQAREDSCVDAIENAFRRANTSVYEFGHQLAAGGRMAASLIGFYISERVVAVGRAGNVSAYLLRAGEICPFFTDSHSAQRETGLRETGFIGENSVVTVELSSIVLREHDKLIAFPSLLSQEQLVRLKGVASRLGLGERVAIETLVAEIYPEHGELPFVLEAEIGPEVIYLGKAERAALPTAQLRPNLKRTDV